MAGAVGGGAGALHRRALAELGGVAAERALVDAPVLGAAERHAVVLELVDRLRRLAREVLHRVGVAEPVRALDGVVHVPLPVVRAHVAEAGGDAALRGDGVAAGREDLGDAGGLQPGLGHAEGGAQAGAAGADDDHVVGVVDELVCGHRATPQAVKAILATAKTPASAKAQQSRVLATQRRGAGRRAVHVVLDHDLHPLLQVENAGQQEEDGDDGVEGLGIGGADRLEVGPEAAGEGEEEEQRQRHQRHRRQALAPPVAGALVGGAEPEDTLPVGAEAHARLPQQRHDQGDDRHHRRADRARRGRSCARCRDRSRRRCPRPGGGCR